MQPPAASRQLRPTPGRPSNPVSDLHELLAYPFMVNALEAGTIVAVMAALIGWFMVLRRQTFAGHTLSVMAFPGAAAQPCSGLSASAGYFVFSAVAAPRDRRGSSRAGSAAATAARSRR